MHYVVAIASRYGALAIQFLIVVLVTRGLAQDDAGQYFMAFGVVATVFCVAGFGLPDGLVKIIGERISSGKLDGARKTIEMSWLITATSCLGISVLASVIAYYLGIGWQVAVGTSVWWLCYALVFFCAQGLVALRAAGLGSFFFYTSTNICLLVTAVPYLLFAEKPQLTGVMVASVAGAAISMLAASLTLAHKLRGMKTGGVAELMPVLRTGFGIGLARMLQAMLYWIPVWIAGIMLSAEDASVIGTAGRLLVAVAAVIAALRFSVRPEIVKAAAENDWRRIEKVGRTISMVSTATTIAAIAVLFFVGPFAISLLFGEKYALAAPILLVLLIGSLGESIGGPVDEILKMTGSSFAVLVGLILTASAEFILAIALSRFGALELAYAQSIAFCFMYFYQLMYIKKKRNLVIFPWWVKSL